MCHRASARTAWQCTCGYEFGQSLERVREMLHDQQTNAGISLALLLVLDAAALVGVVFAAAHGFIVFSALGFTALILATARAARKLLITRASLRQLAEREQPLPKAIVHKR
jgi:hypothetical protein